MNKLFIKWPQSGESSNAPKVPLDPESSEKNINTNFNLDDIINDRNYKNQLKILMLGLEIKLEENILLEAHIN